MNLTPLKFAFLKSGRRQIEVSLEIGISEVRLSKIVNGWYEPNQEEKELIARALGLLVDELWPEEASE